MNIQQLRSLVAISEHRSFSAAANAIGLSHSAISLQIKSLEEEFGRPLFDRSSRPPKLLASGRRTAEVARQALRAIEDVRLVGSGKTQLDTLAVGVVPTTLQDILPFVLGQIRDNHPQMQMTVKSGLSGDLTSQVLNGELDIAIVTSPSVQMAELQIHEIAAEPLFAVANASVEASSDREILQHHPYIAFSRKTWLGQQISARLQSRGIFVDEIMEVNSLDAIVRMVNDGFGVSIVPQLLLAKPLSQTLHSHPFCKPQEVRRLVLIHRAGEIDEEPIQLILAIIKTLQTQYVMPDENSA